mgnify:CR=1 FL=1
MSVGDDHIQLSIDIDIGGTTISINDRSRICDDAGLMDALKPELDEYHPAGVAPSALIDATREIPWRDVVRIIDVLQRHGIRQVDFTAPY